jgi:hypothetical protein
LAAFAFPLSSAEYSYVANSPLVSQILFRQSGTSKMTATKTYDLLNRLTAITNSPAGAGQRQISSAYQYNSANQRTALTNAENGTYWVYTYDSLGQVTSGKKYWNDNNSPVAGQQFEYVFDDIGNRSSTKAGGDSTGANLRSASYLANALNQYTSRTVPGAVDITGLVYPLATVTVNGVTPYRRGEYFRAEVNINNTTGPAYQSIAVNAANGASSRARVEMYFCRRPRKRALRFPMMRTGACGPMAAGRTSGMRRIAWSRWSPGPAPARSNC